MEKDEASRGPMIMGGVMVGADQARPTAYNKWASGSGRLAAASDPTGPRAGRGLAMKVLLRRERGLELK